MLNDNRHSPQKNSCGQIIACRFDVLYENSGCWQHRVSKLQHVVSILYAVSDHSGTIGETIIISMYLPNFYFSDGQQETGSSNASNAL